MKSFIHKEEIITALRKGCSLSEIYETLKNSKTLLKEVENNSEFKLNLLPDFDDIEIETIVLLFCRYCVSLEKITPDFIAKLNSFPLQILVLFDATKNTLSPARSKALAQFKGERLYLNGVTQLNKNTAISLSKFEGKYLSLSGLTQLEEKLAQALSLFKGYLVLPYELRKKMEKYLA